MMLCPVTLVSPGCGPIRSIAFLAILVVADVARTAMQKPTSRARANLKVTS
jgi:hypothetical protein